MWKRRCFIGFSILIFVLVGFAFGGVADDADLVRIGIVADVHAHDTDSPGQGRVLVNYAERLSAFVDAMNAWPAQIVIELGNLVNGRFVIGAPMGEPDRIGTILAHAWSILTAFDGPCYTVIGSHDVYDLTKEEFLTILDVTETYYSFDVGAYHLVILDAQYNKKGEDYGRVVFMKQGNIPEPELAWLKEDLANTIKPTIVCIHQPLDVDFELTAGGPLVFNHKEVQAILAESGVVVAVFQGHTHENGYTEIDGIHYLTFAALFDRTEPIPPTWAQVTLNPAARTITIEGKGIQESLILSYPVETGGRG